MRQLTAGIAVALLSMSAAACGGGNQSAPASSTTTTTSTKPPVAEAALGDLLLTPAEIDTVLGVTGSKSKQKLAKLADDTPKQAGGWKFPDECVYALGPAEAAVYAGSGNTAVNGDDDATTLNTDQDIEVAQVVVLFPSSKEANDFFTTSSQRWPACADRQFTMPAADNNPEIAWKTGPFSNANGTLGITVTNNMNIPNAAVTLTYQRALTVRNNVVIDVAVMRKDPADFGVKVAGQIADKVDKH